MITMKKASETGSFRDPSGCVLYFNGAVYRGVDTGTYALMARLESEGLLGKLADERLIVRTDCVAQECEMGRVLHAEFPHYPRFLAHETVPHVSYPYEWSACMLADAAILHLDLQLRLIKHGYSLKDASAFNVAFIGSRPIFMDLPSIEIPRRLDVWVAYGQFCRMFVFPLLLHRQRGVDFKQSFQCDLNGPSVVLTRRILGWRGALRPAAFVDVFMQYMLHIGAERRSGRVAPSTFNTGTAGRPRAQELNLMRLRSKLCTMAERSSATSSWSTYEQTKSYDPDGNEAKAKFVKEAWTEHRPLRVLDLGCNTGRYSEIATECDALVTAVDSDHDCIDMLYKRGRKTNSTILPLCVDITNPSPALGFRHCERKSFEERADYDGVMGLALIHHLLVAARIPLSAIRDMFAALTKKWLIVEYVDPKDTMFQHLLATRENLYTDLSAEKFEAVFNQQFAILKRQELLNGQRVLYLMRKKGS